MRFKIILVLLIGINFNLSAQSWQEKINSDTSNFFEIQKAFQNNFKKPPLENINFEFEDDEYSKYKRWEYYWVTRVDVEGNFPNSEILWNAWRNYNVNRLKNSSQKNSANWSFVGPSTFISSNAGGIGRVNCMAFHPAIFNTFWVGTPAGGLWKTTDGGVTWSTTSDNLPVLGITDIAIDYTNPDIIYIATGDGETALITPASTKSIGVLKSTNGGITFNPTGLSINLVSQKLIHRLIIHPTNPQILLAAASDGIWITMNGGDTWINQQAGWFADIEFKPTDSNIMYASTLSNIGGSQIYRSINAGITWTQVTNLTGINRIDLAVSPAVPDVVSALCVNTYALGGLEGIYSSINSGASFTKVIYGDCNNNMLGRTFDGQDCGGQGVYDLTYSIHPTNAAEFWVGGINNWKTSDGGQNWNLNTMNTYDSSLNPNGVTYLHSDKHHIAFHPLNPNYVYTCSDAGLHVTNDGGLSWYDLSNGLGISQIYRIGTSAQNPDKVLCGLQDNGLKLHNNVGWLEVMSGDNMEEIIDPIDSNIQYSCALTGVLYRTLDHWSTRTVIANNIPGFLNYINTYGIGPGAWVTPVVMDPMNNQTLYMGIGNVWKTTNRGDTWSPISSFGLSKPLQSMAIAPSNNQIIYTATYDTLFVTVNGGALWSYNIIGNITGNINDKISYITVSPIEPLTLWITVSGFVSGHKIYKSVNGGSSWTNISGSLPNIPVNCSVYENGSNDGVYIGTDLGVYYRDNSLLDWVSYNIGLPNVQVNELEISYINNKLWAATFGRGLWKSDLYSSVGIDENNKRISNVSIFPNPSDGIFNIQTNNTEKTLIEIYDVLGIKIYESDNISSFSVIDLSTFSNGTYFAKIFSGNGYCLKKIMIIK